MNIYEKLNLARLKFAEKGIKQNGHNDYAGYSYFDLADILPVVNKINEEIKVVTVVRFDKDIAYLDFINAEKTDEVISFTSPMSDASLKGCHAVQNLGAVETYLKRYLYQNCYEIAEGDVLDKTMNPNEQNNSHQKTAPKTAPKPQQKAPPKTIFETPAMELEYLLNEYSEKLNVTSANGKNPYSEAEDCLRTGSDSEVAEMLGKIKTFLSKVK